MNKSKQEAIFEQYINQYKAVITPTLVSLRENRNDLHIPYAQFLFSLIDYYGLLFVVATKGKYKKRDKQNFINFLSSDYFPQSDRCKASFIYFIRNGIIHQIFPKGSSVGISSADILFFKDIPNGNIPGLNLIYFDKVTVAAIHNFTEDLKIRSDYIDSLYDLLVTKNYGFGDHDELKDEINTSFGGDIQRIFCIC